MQQHFMDGYLRRFDDVLKKVTEEVKKLYQKQEEINTREKNILKIRNDVALILQIVGNGKSTPKPPSEIIKSIEKIIDIKHQTDVYSLLELSDSRIATGDWNGTINIFSIDYEKKTFTLNIEHQGHNETISSFCQLSGNRLVSAGDETIKIWKINATSLTHLQTLEGHTKSVNQVISLSNDVIASGSYDKTIKIWEVYKRKELQTLGDDFEVYSLLKLKNKEFLLSTGLGEQVTFWNLRTYKKEHTVRCCIGSSYKGLLELSNNYVAVTGGGSSSTASIDIIDVINHKLFKKIKYDCITGDGYYPSLSSLNKGTFIYAHNNYLCQLSANNFDLKFKIKTTNEMTGISIISNSSAKYLISTNEQSGISIFKIEYS